MQRDFLIIQDRAPTDGDFNLNSLSNHGRLDISCRFLNATLFTSYDLREDVTVHLIFRGPPDPPVHLMFDGSKITGLHPDHRSIAGYLRTNLKRYANTGEPANEGVSIDDSDIGDVLEEVETTPVLLTEDGDDIGAIALPEHPLFIVGEHKGFSEKDRKTIMGNEPYLLSIGPDSYQAKQVASYLNVHCDRL